MEQRKIKFRGKDAINGKWLYGYYYKSKDGFNKIITKDGKDRKIIAYTQGEYTGLKDKNGQEIYEGDIVKDYSDIGLYKDGKSEVNFYAGSFVVTHYYDLLDIPLNSFDTVWEQNSYEGDKEKASWLATIEVIGNIHENPELI